MANKYLKSLLFTATLSLTGMLGAQNADHQMGLEVNGGYQEYHGDLGSALFFGKKPNYQAGGINFGYYINPYLDAVIYGGSGDIGFYTTLPNVPPVLRDAGFRTRIIHAQMGLRFKFNNGSMMPEDSKFAPFLQLGWGGIQYISRINNVASTLVDYSGIASGGGGIAYQASPRITVRLTTMYNYTFNDIWDGEADIPNNSLIHYRSKNNDGFMYHSLGVAYNFGAGKGTSGPRDRDKDGVIDKLDKCPRTPEGYKVDENGCELDSDKDSINDAFDECPFEFGPRSLNGCPDTDGDGLRDKEDECPTVKGSLEHKGCPDTDGDGIRDKDDHCPNVAGLEKFHGCPDRDGDGIEDHMDKCPDHSGTVEGEGCPDTDGDGVYDHNDVCPTVAGVKENKGCPEIKAEVKQKIALAAKGINFETASDVIKAESFDDLDKLVAILNEYPEAKVEIQGHTDNSGVKDVTQRKANNLDLSQRRANSVKAYLESHGVAAARLTSIGYGEEKPIADNTSKAGKAKNRRVDFVLTY